MYREGLKGKPCVEGRALSGNRKRMGRRLNREEGKAWGKGEVGGNAPDSAANMGILTSTHSAVRTSTQSSFQEGDRGEADAIHA